MNLYDTNNIRIIYASSAMGEKTFSDIFINSKNIPGQQAQKFNRLLIKGLKLNGVDVIGLSTPPVTTSNLNKKFIVLGKKIEDEILFSYVPVINIPILKNILNIAGSFFKTLKYRKKNKTIIVCDVLNVSVSLGAVFAGILVGCPIVGIVTDIPELMVTGHLSRQVKLIYKILDKCSHYVFLTEPMNARLNPTGKPYVIIEGICNENTEHENFDHNNHSIYAGYLDEKYGIKALIEAFILANVDGQELHIYGAGPYAEEAKRIANESDSIVYHGSVLNEIVVAEEKKARLLINPRPSNEEFTKYSFPSKNMEYMASGTPVLTTKLLGMTKDYYEYVYCFKDETVEGMSETLKTILEKDDEQLLEKGKEAQHFVMMQKNNLIQARKILALVKNN